MKRLKDIASIRIQEGYTTYNGSCLTYAIIFHEFSEPLSPEHLKELKDLYGDPARFGKYDLVAINGRMPIWYATALAEYFHATKSFATYDPRLGYVVVSSHSPHSPAIGEVITLSDT